MRILKSFNCVLILLLFAFLLACFHFHLSSNPTVHFDEKLFRKPDHTEQELSLKRVLERVSMPDRTVILSTVNYAWAGPGSILDLFLESFRIGEGTERLLNHVLIVAMDQRAFIRCKSIHSYCYSLVTPGVDFAHEQQFMTPDYLKLVWRRIEFLQMVLELGYNFIFTDADVMWLRNPFSHFNALDEIMIASDFYMGDPTSSSNRASTGFYYVKSDGSTIEFYKYWYMARTLYPNAHDQFVFEIIKHHPIVNMGMRIRYLNTAYFGGFCQLSRNMEEVCTIHANCCVGVERKLHDLRLVLDDWKNNTRVSSEQKKGFVSSSLSPWRAPSRCKTLLESTF